MEVSVITPVRSDPELIWALRSVPSCVEYIVALTNAPDRVRALVQDFKRNQRPDLVIVDLPVTGMSAGVNAGTQLAKHEKIVILDSDCTLTQETLDAYSNALETADFVRGVTHVRQEGFWSSIAGLGQEELNQVFSTNRARLIGPSIAFRRTAFLLLGGYDLHIGGSCDHEFVLRLEDRGCRTAFEEKAVIWHASLTFRIDVRSHYGYGRSMRAIDAKRGGWYGFGVCIDRWAPRTLWRKLLRRGPTSLLRSLVLGGVMLAGYVRGLRRFGGQL